MRRAVPYAVLPLAMIAVALAAAPWLRSYPGSTLAAPLFGACVLAVLVPVVAVGIGLRRLWQTALLDAVLYLLYTLVVVLREFTDVGRLWDGIVHGPSQILTFALPLVSPRSLLVAPVTLTWAVGAVCGEVVARSWRSVLPYAAVLVGFGLAYAATARAITGSGNGRRVDALLAGGLLLTLLLWRAAQAWLDQDAGAEAAQADGVLPLRGLGWGVTVAAAVAVIAALAVQSTVFPGAPDRPTRRPPVDRGRPLSPVSFVEALRPADPQSAGTPLFTVQTDRRTSAYVAIADLDRYDGDGWTFARTFRPSGGVVPADADPSLRPQGADVTQQYRITAAPLAGSPWLPFTYRPTRVTGTAVDVDTGSGMVVPARPLQRGSSYSVTSQATTIALTDLPATAAIATSTAPAELAVPGALGESLGTVVASFSREVRVAGSDRLAFLQALTADLRRNYRRAGGQTSGSTVAPASSTPRSASRSASRSGSASRTGSRRPRSSTRRASTSAGPSGTARSTPARSTPARSSPTPSVSAGTASSGSGGGTAFAGVLASILGAARVGTPEQYATLVALVARQIGVPARLVTGFRLGSGATVAAGTHRVTTGEAWTWVEIPVQGQGWVVVDAAPRSLGGAAQQPSASARPTSSPTPTLTPNGLVTQGNRGNAVAPRSSVPGDHGLSHTTVIVVVAVLVGIVLLAILLVPPARRRSRMRRRRGSRDPRRRVVGAWQESLDLLAEAGLPSLRTATGAEVAARTQDRFGGEPAAQVRYLGEAANTAIFSPSSWLGAQDADAAWHAHAVLRRGIRRRMTRPQRMAAAFRVRRADRSSRTRRRRRGERAH